MVQVTSAAEDHYKKQNRLQCSVPGQSLLEGDAGTAFKKVEPKAKRNRNCYKRISRAAMFIFLSLTVNHVVTYSSTCHYLQIPACIFRYLANNIEKGQLSPNSADIVSSRHRNHELFRSPCCTFFRS